jgi:predicted transcriptional regulator
MLGVRLKPDEERALARHARAMGKPKSTLAREWIMDRLEREEIDRKIAHAAALDAQAHRPLADRFAEESAAAFLRWLDAEDGGYDWGAKGPPGAR